MKLKVTVVEGNPKVALSLWGSKSGSTGGFAETGAEFEIEGDEVSMNGRDPVPGNQDAAG